MSSNGTSYAAAVASKLANEHVADVVEVLNGLEPALAAEVLAKMPIERATHILGQPGFDHPQKLIERLPVDCAVAILGAMAAGWRAENCRGLGEPCCTICGRGAPRT